ncbi:benzoate/H(+) symporter BenE family transporter [Pseudaeromonas sharmana]|uniref:Benzoate/H(+) symporter BenE family transporter n=1 Tax=Pseudaeromonas sharmana TaxID=328412 RepID=A0ABV8CM43_9GAMM
MSFHFPVRLHHLSSGLVAVLVGYTSSAAIIFQAASSAGATPAQLGSWMTALGLGMGATTLGLSWYYRAPILTAWSTPGAALLITSLHQVTMAEAIGAFILCAMLLMVAGFSGLFARLMHRLPLSLAAAMLAGILLRFGLDLFHALEQAPWLVGSMLLLFLLLKRRMPRYTLALVLLLGIALAAASRQLQPLPTMQWLQLQWTAPVFSWQALLGVALPLFVVTMSSQNLPGIAVLRSHGYGDVPISPLIGCSGLANLLLAPFGCFALNLAAITAALCMTEQADIEPRRRYLAACCAGGLYLLTGVLGASVAGILASLPAPLIMAIAGMALLTTLGNSLLQSLQQEPEREAALLTFLVTASGIQFAGIGSPFWGLLGGSAVLMASRYHRRHSTTG